MSGGICYYCTTILNYPQATGGAATTGAATTGAATDISTLVNKGNVFLKQGNYVQAILYYDKSLAKDPNYKEALVNKGNALYHEGNNAKAIQYYNKALAIDPNNKSASHNKNVASHPRSGSSSSPGTKHHTEHQQKHHVIKALLFSQHKLIEWLETQFSRYKK